MNLNVNIVHLFNSMRYSKKLSENSRCVRCYESGTTKLNFNSHLTSIQNSTNIWGMLGEKRVLV